MIDILVQARRNEAAAAQECGLARALFDFTGLVAVVRPDRFTSVEQGVGPQPCRELCCGQDFDSVISPSWAGVEGDRDSPG